MPFSWLLVSLTHFKYCTNKIGPHYNHINTIQTKCQIFNPFEMDMSSITTRTIQYAVLRSTNYKKKKKKMLLYLNNEKELTKSFEFCLEIEGWERDGLEEKNVRVHQEGNRPDVQVEVEALYRYI